MHLKLAEVSDVKVQPNKVTSIVLFFTLDWNCYLKEDSDIENPIWEGGFEKEIRNCHGHKRIDGAEQEEDWRVDEKTRDHVPF